MARQFSTGYDPNNILIETDELEELMTDGQSIRNLSILHSSFAMSHPEIRGSNTMMPPRLPRAVYFSIIEFSDQKNQQMVMVPDE